VKNLAAVFCVLSGRPIGRRLLALCAGGLSNEESRWRTRLGTEIEVISVGMKIRVLRHE
jgi:hypothetical protein